MTLDPLFSSNKVSPFGAFVPSGRLSWLLKLFGATGGARGRVRRVALRWLRQNYSGPIDATVAGFNARLYLHDNNCEAKALLAGRAYCKNEFKHLRNHIPAGGTFIDIGANVGLFSMYAASCHIEQLKIIAVEPNPNLLPRLKFNISINNLNDVIEVYEVALGPKAGSAFLQFNQTQLGSGSLLKDEGSDSSKVEVPVLPLVEVLSQSQVEKIDILKIDVEGFEDRVLVPFFENAQEQWFPKSIIIEDNQGEWETDLLELFSRLKYEVVWSNRSNMIWCRRD